jgi:NADP-dependent 3-hydroxy acid dehydrogenase YdfG
METILITGASSTFAKKFYNSIKEKKIQFIFLDKTKPKISEFNNIDFFKINFENSKSIKNTIDNILKKYKRIDYVVTYASFRSNKKNIEDESLDNWNKTFAVNLTSNFFLIKNIILNNIKKKKKV